MKDKPEYIYKFSNVFRSPLKLIGVLAIILIFAGIATAWTYTTPPLFDCVANGTCYFGNYKSNETTTINQFIQGDGSNLTNVNADTVDTYHLNQGVRTTDSPTFVTVNANVSGDNINTTDGKQLANIIGGCSYLINVSGSTVTATNCRTWVDDYSDTDILIVLNSTVQSANSNYIVVNINSNLSSNSSVWLKSNTNIQSIGTGYILSSGTNHIFQTLDTDVLSNIEISGFRIDKMNYSGRAIQLPGKYVNVRIHDNIIENDSSAAIAVHNTSSTLSENVYVYRNVLTDVFAGVLATADNIWIEKNVISMGTKNSSSSTEYGEGIDVNNQSRNIHILRNNVSGFREDGIDTFTNIGGEIVGNRVIGNKSETRTNRGIVVGSDMIVSNNIVSDSGNNIVLAGVNSKIDNNILSRAKDTGYSITYSTDIQAIPTNTTISNNYIAADGGQYGIFAESLHGLTITSNQIYTPNSINLGLSAQNITVTNNVLNGTIDVTDLKGSLITNNYFINGVKSGSSAITTYMYNNFGLSPMDYGSRSSASNIGAVLGDGDSYYNSTSHQKCWYRSTSFQNATGDTEVC